LKKEFYKLFKTEELPSSIDNDEDRKLIKNEIYQRLQQSIGQQHSTKGKVFTLFATFRYQAAAVLVGICTLSLIAYIYQKQHLNTEYITVQAPKGKVLEVFLPDQSKITLNAASTIKYPTKFIDTRDIYLEEGEAYFDVAHDESKPFIVHTGAIHTKVLGTAFNIKSYKALPNITVTVARGKVQVNENSKNLDVLTIDKQLTFNKADHRAITQNIKASSIVSWTHGDFNLNGVYFNEIMLAIANRFKVKMIYDAKVFRNCENSIRFTHKQSLTDVLQVLKTIQPIKYTLKNDSVFISGKPCQ